MANFLLIGVCILAGILLRRSETIPSDAYKGINAWIIYVALPAISFKYLPHIQWTSELLVPALAPIVTWIGGYLFVRLYAKIVAMKGNPLDNATIGGLTLVTALSNTSFVGFPLVLAFYGAEYIGIAVISDQVTFLILSTVGVIVAIRASETDQEISVKRVLLKVLKFPPMIGAVSALTLPHFINIDPVYPMFDIIAATVAPMALFSIGLQIKFSGWLADIKTISAVLIFKLILAPAIIFIIILSLQLKGIIAQVSVFEMAMPSLLSSTIVASEYNLNPRLINLIVYIGVLAGFVTTSVWYIVLKIIA